MKKRLGFLQGELLIAAALAALAEPSSPRPFLISLALSSAFCEGRLFSDCSSSPAVDRTFIIPSVFVILFFFCSLHKFSIFHDTLFSFTKARSLRGPDFLFTGFLARERLRRSFWRLSTQVFLFLKDF